MCAPPVGIGPVGRDELMRAADVQVVHEVPVADEQRVAARGVAVGDQHAVGAIGRDLDVGRDRVAAAAQVGRHVARHVAHPGPERVVRAGAVEPGGVRGEALTEPVVEGEHLVGLGLGPPQPLQFGQPVGLLGREVVVLVEVAARS